MWAEDGMALTTTARAASSDKLTFVVDDSSSTVISSFKITPEDCTLRKEFDSPYFRAVLVKLAAVCATVGALIIGWELLIGQHSVFLLASAVSSIVVMTTRGDLRSRMVPDITSLIPRVAASVSTATGLVLLGSLIVSSRRIAGDWLLLVLLAILVAAMLGAVLGVALLRSLWRSGHLRSRAVLLGTGRLSREFAVEIDHHQGYGVDVVGIVGPVPAIQPHTTAYLGDFEDLPRLITENKIDRLIVMPGDAERLVRPMRWANSRAGLLVFIVPRFYSMGFGLDSVSPDRARGYPLALLSRTTHRQAGVSAKRAFDIAVSALALVVLSPALLAVAAVLKATSPRESVFFRQERVGQYGRTFHIRKFRSMSTSHLSDHQWMGDAEARVTRFGGILRKTSLDEVPQLLNVLVGDMSLVGPRPERPHFVDKFGSEIEGYNDRHRMPVGLTGLSQIVGLRGDTSIAERVKFDNIYIDQWRFKWDLEIMVKTARAVLRSSQYATDAAAVEEQLHTELNNRAAKA
jgi:exopolysaccharide biosynthesis polyprenyl glycosylphosphotransferase